MAIDNGNGTQATRLKMNVIFFTMSLVMLIVMAISMWKDTHPEWRSYQEKFAVVERKLLLARKADLERQVQHPDPIGDYKAAVKQYAAAKAVFDTNSSALDDTEANLEELELAAKGGQGEGEGGGEASSDEEGGGGATEAAAKPAQPAKASDADLAALDKEFKNDKEANPPDNEGSSEQAAPSQPAAAPSKDDMAELDKEFKSNPPSTEEGPESKQAAPASKASAPPTGNSKEASKASAPAPSNSKEMSELDKEFQSSSAPKAEENAGSEPASKTASAPALTFEEANFTIDSKGADDRLEGAQRGFLNQQRLHTKEMIALPADEVNKRKLADALLKEAQQKLDLALSDVELQKQKQQVKQAAQIAMWSQDLTQIQNSKNPADAQKRADLEAKLADHMNQVQRDLRLVNDRLDRNRSGAPEVQQVFVEHLGAVDRCETCHRGIEDPLFANAEQPFKTHPGNLLKSHPVERFGCTSCHGGFGGALEKDEAHGGIVGKGKPLMVGDVTQASCGKCHGESKELPGASTYLFGARLFRDSGCLGCHKVESIETPQKAGPDLDRINEKVGAAWLMAWLKNPRSHSIEARMPNFGLKPDEVQAIAAYLLSQHGNPPLDALPPPPATTPEKLAAGKALVSGLGCLGCHSIKGEGNNVGPELTNLRSKVRPEWLYAWIENPKAYMPNSRMPVFGLTKDQCRLIGDYLLSISPPRQYPPFSQALFTKEAAETGAKLIAARGCAGCHNIKGFDRIAAPELTHVGDKTTDVLEFGNFNMPSKTPYKWLVQKLKDPSSYDTKQFQAKMPKFGLSDEEARAISVYLLSLNSDQLPPEYTKGAQEQDSPMSAGRRIFADHNCAGCHRIAGEGGKVGPDLSREGERVQPIWLFGFLEHPERIRWWQDARMPNFHLSQAEATTLVEYLMELSNQPAPYEYTPPDKMVFPLADEGAKYFIDLKCQSCHPMGGKQAVVGGDTKKLGPDLAMAPRRLKGNWMFLFLKDPQAFDPGTQMPTFQKDDHTYHALVDFLMKSHSP